MKKNKPYNSGQWTEARMRSFVMSALRRASWPVKYKIIKDAFHSKGINEATGRKVNLYTCGQCKGLFMQKDMQADHIDPIVPVTGFDSWDGVVGRIFCEADGFQALCKGCHKEKTAQENAERKQQKENK